MIKQFIYKLLNIKTASEEKEGVVKFFNKTKRFGFITVEDSDDEIFVHSKNLIDKIKKNDRVTFGIEKSEKGLIAVKVRLS